MSRRFNTSLFNDIPGRKLFLVSLKYRTESADNVAREKLAEAHQQFLQTHFDREKFLTVGSRIDQSGEVVIAGNLELGDLQQIMGEDPFFKEGLVIYQITTFMPTMKFADFHDTALSDDAHELLIISLNYREPLAETLAKIDELLPAHRQFLERHYRSGSFLISGRKDPRTGGVILSQSPSQGTIEEILDEDPFAKNTLTDREIIRISLG